MSNIEKLRQKIENSIKAFEFNGGIYDSYEAGELSAYQEILNIIDSLPEDASCVYDTNKFTPTPSVNIEDVARVQFASHAHVFDHKRKAVFDWEQFKEVVGIFYGFGKKNSQPDENPSEDLEEAAENYIAPIENDEGLDYINFNGRNIKDAFIAGAEWMRKKDVEDMYMSDNRHFLKCYDQGKVDMKVEMMKDAVEGEAEELYNDGESQCTVSVGTYFKPGDEVYVIKKED